MLDASALGRENTLKQRLAPVGHDRGARSGFVTGQPLVLALVVVEWVLLPAPHVVS